MRVSLLMMLLLLFLTRTATSSHDVKPGCQEKCGNVSVPYPFGIGEPYCAMDEHFFLNCSSENDDAVLWFRSNMTAQNISVLEGTVTVSIETAYDCYDSSGESIGDSDQSMTLGSGPFMFSESGNIFTAIGCNTQAVVANEEVTYGVACLSLCNENVNISDKNSCSGSGCCQTSIPKGLKSLYISVYSGYNYTEVPFNRCGFAFLAAKSSFDLSDWPLSRMVDAGKDTSDVVVEWVVKNETCEQAKANASAYACGSNTDCTFSESGQGYRCSCSKGFQGNAYLQLGCQDIDECEDPERYPCKGTCKNTIGDYKCHCPFGKYGDGKTGCQGSGIITVISAVGASVFFLIICFLLYVICTKRRRDKNFRENGGMVLKHQRVADEGEMEEIEIVCELAKKCVNSMGINRPTMKEVSYELAKLKALHENSWAQKTSDETARLLGKSPPSFSENESPSLSQSQSTHTVISFQIENYTDSILDHYQSPTLNHSDNPMKSKSELF
ncbi:unnamed protein product [Dovyalis caffra]|uniref:EGF-like domain-containing protein n=1 Tax=Dovyalis caffra TaxID=77055 RepID=A0AAV1R8T3_9ROSI|nr:unnamed protein product [Dovyalis caffra]